MNPTTEAGKQLVLAELSHHGVLGMKWGFKKTTDVPTPRATEANSIVPHAPLGKTKIEVHGGENHPAHNDAINVALANEKLKKSGVHALSNKELQDVATRLNLEHQVRTLHAKKPESRGQAFINKQMKEIQKDPVKTALTVHRGVKAIQQLRQPMPA